MKASVMSRAGDVRVEEVPDPVIEEPTDAIIQAGRYHEVAGSLRSPSELPERGCRSCPRDSLLLWFRHYAGRPG
jgi:hypothetical protein